MKDKTECLLTNNGWSNTVIDKVIKTGAHDNLNISDKDFINSINVLLTEAGLVSGINVFIGHKNSTKEDMILNLRSIIRTFEHNQGR